MCCRKKTRLPIALTITIAAIASLAGCASSGVPIPNLHVTLGNQNRIALKADAGGQLMPTAKGDTAGATVTARLKQTDATPFAVKGDPTRPYLTVNNGLGKPVYFRVFAREKGSTEFFEVRDIEQPVEPGGNHILKCWESGSRVEEITLSEFSLSR